jgi:hypothetical protein
VKLWPTNAVYNLNRAAAYTHVIFFFKKVTNICDNTEAVKLWPTNAVYYSNRAAAYTHMQMYDEAIAGSQKKKGGLSISQKRVPSMSLYDEAIAVL